MASITKAELLKTLAEKTGATRKQVEEVLESFFDVVVERAKEGEKVGWPGFGSFVAQKRPARKARNPRTGETVRVKASTALKFRPSTTLKEAMNSRRKTRRAGTSTTRSAATTRRSTSRTTTRSSSSRRS